MGITRDTAEINAALANYYTKAESYGRDEVGIERKQETKTGLDAFTDRIGWTGSASDYYIIEVSRAGPVALLNITCSSNSSDVPAVGDEFKIDGLGVLEELNFDALVSSLPQHLGYIQQPNGATLTSAFVWSVYARVTGAVGSTKPLELQFRCESSWGSPSFGWITQPMQGTLALAGDDLTRFGV